MILLVFLLFASTECARVAVDSEYGRIIGESFTLHNGKTVNRFHGIPFAKPPVGALRFADPQEVDPFTEDFVADELPHACSQNVVGLLWLTHPLWKKYSEDCLTLNVYTPNDASEAPYPVMVWLHGGGYITGGSIQYPGHFLASKDVVVVVINYRIGPHGFLSTGDDAARGNFGLKDQILALKWVQKTISSFGGDPGKVTLFGQSAGASSAALLMMSPLAEGLFHQVIAESGTDQAIWGVNEPAQNPEEYSKQFAQNLGCPTDDTYAMIDCLREVPTEQLYGTGFDCKEGYFCQGFAPVVDGPGGVLPDDPWTLRAQGNFVKMPVIQGQCSDDGSLYTLILIPESSDGGFNRSSFETILRERLISLFTGGLPGKEDLIFNAINWYYSFQPFTDDLDLNRESFNRIITDFAFGMTGDIALKSQAQYVQDVYHYVLGYRSANADPVFPPWLGVPHNGELPYVFGWPWLKLNRNIQFDSGILINIIDWDEKDIAWSEYIMTMWTNFAKYSNPTPEPVPRPYGHESTVWPRFNQTDYKYMSLYDESAEVATAYRQKTFEFWLDYIWNLVELPPIGSAGNQKPAQKAKINTKVLQDKISDFYKNMVSKMMKN